MKTQKTCSKCSSTQITVHLGRRLPFGAGNYIMIGRFCVALVDRAVCLECGYCEEWVSPTGLKKLRERGAYIAIPKPGALNDLPGEL